jgi:beta-mannosidase
MGWSAEHDMTLTGPGRMWRAEPATEAVRRDAIGMSFDDSAWEPITTPGHWRTAPSRAALDGPLMYRHRFDTPAALDDGTRRFVVLDGVFAQADVWLDGAYLGDPEGYFFPHAFDVTSLLAMGEAHVLAVEVSCPPQRDKRAKRLLTGVFQHWDAMDDTWTPGGLWRDVRIETTGPVRVDAFSIACRDANESRAHVALSAQLDSTEAREISLKTRVDGVVQHERTHHLARGVNDVTWSFDIPSPRLWWPYELGESHLTDVTCEVWVDGVLSHGVTRRTGLREVALGEWVFSINGERLFVRGTNHAPTRQALADATPAELRRDVELARELGLNMMRVHAHVSRPEFYDAADELGMLVWQDMPLQWGYARSVRRQAVRQARALVNHFGHHPSIAVWCGHNEPLALRIDHGSTDNIPKVAAAYLAGQQLPTWNKTILDRWIKTALERADESRPVVAHSGVLPHLPQIDGTDSHLYFGWYHGNERDLPAFARRLPRLVRFVSEFGAQSVPDTLPDLDTSQWPDIDWDDMAARFGAQKAMFDRHVPPAAFDSFAEWRDATQAYQAQLLFHHIRELRRLKYSPTGGFMFFSFADPAPRVSWSVLDHERSPKLAWHAVKEACAPVIVVVDRLPETIDAGDTHELAVHVVNDLRRDLADAQVTVRVSAGEWNVSRTWAGDVPKDDVCYVGTLQVTLPATTETPTVASWITY